MIEKIKSFFSRASGEKKTIVEQGRLWRCTKCELIFLSESAGEKHNCLESGVNDGKV